MNKLNGLLKHLFAVCDGASNAKYCQIRTESSLQYMYFKIVFRKEFISANVY